MEPSLNSWTTIFLVVALHGIVLSAIFFFRKKGKSVPNTLLGTFLLLFSVELLTYVAFWTRYSFKLPHILGVSATFHFLYGPILFLYVLSILRTNIKWKKWDFLHFIPFVLFLIYIAPIYLQTAVQKAAIIQESFQSTFELSDTARIVVILKFLHMAVYAGLIFNIRKVGNYFGINYPKASQQKKAWGNIVTYCFTGFILSYMLFYVMVETIGYSLESDYMISFTMSAFIFVIGYLGFARPDYLYEAHNGAKYENSSLEEDEANKYLEQLLTYMKEQRPYIDGDLKLEDIANELNIPRHHLSQIINERLGKNYFEFINSYRIDEAKKILSDPNKDYKILRVALESGFNNKTTFNNAFKSKVGTTPSKFRKEHSNGNIIHS